MIKFLVNNFKSHSTKKISCFFIFLSAFTLFQVNCVYYKHHDQNAAARSALEFSINAFVKNDFEKAHTFLRNDTNESFDSIKLKELIAKMHPTDQYPIELKATEYEIVPNSGLIRIYLQGKGKNNEMHYYLISTVPRDDIYKISELYRKDDPYPKNSLTQPLN